jgi:hypothetical protein
MERIKQVSERAYEFGKESGWGEFECCHGYGVFNGDYPTDYGLIEGDHIEVIGEMDGDKGFWELDNGAANHYEANYGYKIIRDIKGIEPVFIDTPENRAKIMKQIKEGGN